MAQILHADKEIKLKIVYYGPALSGKTTNLIYVHQVLFPSQKVKLFSINTGDDRTLFFDLLPLDLGKVSDYDLKLQLFTVPGQVMYDQTRRAVLSNSDGVVFVADSQKNQLDSNLESYENLKTNLEVNEIDHAALPLVIQYNKQDLPEIYSIEELDQALNDNHRPTFGATAIAGVGVLQTLKQSIHQVLKQFSDDFQDFSLTEIEQKIDRSFEAVLDSYQKKTHFIEDKEQAEEDFSTRLHDSSKNIQVTETREDLSQSQFLEKAVETNIKMAELYHELNAKTTMLDQKNREMTILGEISQALTGDFIPEQLPKMIFKSILMTFETVHGIYLEYNHEIKKLSEKFISGFDHDPLYFIPSVYGDSIANQLFIQRKAFHFNVFSFEDTVIPGIPVDQFADHLKKNNIMSVMSVPIQSGKMQYGLLNLYQMIDETSVLTAFDVMELKFFAKLSATFALSLDKLLLAHQARSMDQYSGKTEDKKIVELQGQISTLLTQNRDQQRRINKLETFYRPVARMDQRRDSLLGEFKTKISKPISSILTACKILDKFGVNNEENVHKFLAVTQDESGKFTQIVDNFESGSSNYFQEMDFSIEVFHPSELLQYIRELCVPKIKIKRLEWREEIPEELPPIRGDKDKFFFVAEQFVENALQFTSAGHIEIQLKYDPVYNDRFLVISVSDSGIGIPKADMPRVFDRFFKGEKDSDGDAERFGLGLALCKEIVEFFSGRIWIKSEEGVSTTISAEIPVEQQ